MKKKQFATALGAALAAFVLFSAASPCSHFIGLRAAHAASTAAVPAQVNTDAIKQHHARVRDNARAAIPASPWKEQEKKLYRDLLNSVHPQIVVLPFQVSAHEGMAGVDIAARRTMAYMVAQRYAKNAKVADVEHVSRALGDPRRMTAEEARMFGMAIGAGTVVFGEVGREKNGRMAVTLKTLPVRGVDQSKVAGRSGIEITDAVPPEIAFAKVVDSMVRELGLAGAEPIVPSIHRVSAEPLKNDPLDALRASSANMADAIWLQSLIAVLYPNRIEGANSAVFERVLAALEYLSPESPDYALLKARALLYLGRRPAAVELLNADSRRPQERALRAYIDGNVPEMEQWVPRIRDPIARLIAELELVSTRWDYGLDNDTLDIAVERIAQTVPREWAPAVVWHLTGRNNWNQRATLEVKLVLDKHFPLKDFAAQQVVRGKALVGSPDAKTALQIQASPFEHVNRVVRAHSEAWAYQQPAWLPRPFQYLALLDKHTESMLLASVDFVWHTQGLRDEGLQLIDAMDDVVFLRGNIELSLRKARFLAEMLRETAQPDRRLALAEQMYLAAKRVRHWNTTDADRQQEAMRLESTAAYLLKQTQPDIGIPALFPDLHDMKEDVPPTLSALQWHIQGAAPWYGDHLTRLSRACAYTRWWAVPCDEWRKRAAALENSVLAASVEKRELATRFQGSPRRVDALIAAAKSRGDINAASAYAEQNVKLNPDAWAGYLRLGSLHLERGDYAAAAATFARYPQFNGPPSSNTVGISNDAGDVAYELARRGAVKEARQFFEIAARHQNGSGASMSAAMSLAYYDRHFADAEVIGQARARRYPQGPSFRAYFSLLFALGETDNAWAGVREALLRQNHFSIWRAVPVGLRVQGADVDQVRQWAKQAAPTPDRSPGSVAPNAVDVLTIAFHVLSMDRPVASMDVIESVAAELFPDWRKTMKWENVAEVQRAELKAQVERTTPRFGRENPATPRMAQRKDYTERFALGYRAFKRGDYNGAAEAFQHWSEPSILPSFVPVHAAGLPYHAYAAVKAGQTKEFTEYLDRVSKPAKPDAQGNVRPALPDFDLNLARAVMAALHGKHELARRHLVLARGSIAEPDTRPLPPEYVYAEICELLGVRETLPGYVDMAVDWAKVNQVYEPWAAWAYSFEAKHAKPGPERVRAFAIARYLDPKSERIADLGAELKESADRWLLANKPFPRDRAKAERL